MAILGIRVAIFMGYIVVLMERAITSAAFHCLQGESASASSRHDVNLRMTTVALMIFSMVVGVMPTLSYAANLPCSGGKGGVAMCRGDLFVCNDGSISASKKSCSKYMGGAADGMDSPALDMTPSLELSPEGGCSCRSGKICVGPRGGRFCLTDSGAKSYLRR